MLVRTARRLFAGRGYDSVSAEEIARAAGVTRPTLYYHFRDKKDLFLAVCDGLERECSERVTRAGMEEAAPREQLQAACRAALDTFLDQDYRRIMVLDGPVVLGWKTWSGLLSRYGRVLLRRGLENASGAGLLDPRLLGPTTALVVGAINEAGLRIAHSEKPRQMRREFGRAIGALVKGLTRQFGRGAEHARQLRQKQRP